VRTEWREQTTTTIGRIKNNLYIFGGTLRGGRKKGGGIYEGRRVRLDRSWGKNQGFSSPEKGIREGGQLVFLRSDTGWANRRQGGERESGGSYQSREGEKLVGMKSSTGKSAK